MTHSMDDLLEAIQHAHITPDHDHFNTVDTIAMELMAKGVINARQLRNASALARIMQTDA